jgi:hypothetical protein
MVLVVVLSTGSQTQTAEKREVITKTITTRRSGRSEEG